LISDFKNICVIIPAYNEANTLEFVISEIRGYLPSTRIVVVDDGSDDDTSKVAQRSSVQVVKHPKNYGKGAALISGFKVALEEKAEWIATIDGDGQHEPKFLYKFAELAQTQNADIAIGSRMNNLSNMPMHRILSNKITSMLVSWRAGWMRIEDSQCGYRLIHRRVLQNIKLSSGGFQTESELLIRAGMHGYRIVSVPISTLYGSSASSIRYFYDVYKFMILIVKSLFW